MKSESWEIVFGTMLEEIADRIRDGKATKIDAHELRRFAAAARGEKWAGFQIKALPAKSGNRGRQSAERKLAMARAIASTKAEAGCTRDEAIELTKAQFNVETDTMLKAWKEMRWLLNAPSETINTVMYFHGLEARGLVKISRVKK